MRYDGNLVVIFGLIGYLIVRGILLLLKKKNRKSLAWFKELIGLFFVSYALMVVSVTLFPIYTGIPRYHISINYIPLKSIFRAISEVGTAYDGDAVFMIKLIVKNVAGNIIMFMPLGFLVPILWGRCDQFKKLLLIGLLASIGIEFLQLIENILGVVIARVVDIDDVICNAFGAMLGYFSYKLICSLFAKRKFSKLTS